MKMENRQDFHHDDLLQEAVDAVVRGPQPDDVSPDRVAQLTAALRQAADQPYPISIITRIKNMRLSTRIAIAAAVLAAILAPTSWFVFGTGPSVAFAAVAEAMTNVRSVTWKTTTIIKEPGNKTSQIKEVTTYLAPSLSRMEHDSSDGGKSITIVDGEQKKAIYLDVTAKTARIQQWNPDTKDPPPENPSLNEFQQLQKLFTDARNGKGEKIERLDSRTIDGRDAQGFRLRIRETEVRIWADSKTLLPIRVESKTLVPQMSSEVTSEMTDFQVGVDLDKSLFSLDVPTGYTIEKQAIFGRLQMSPKEEAKAKPQQESSKTPKP
jgi:outer membrane lipoprotein-sorting protein